MWFFNKDKSKETVPTPDKQQESSPTTPPVQKLKQTGSIPRALLDPRLKQTGGISKSGLTIPKELMAYNKPTPAVSTPKTTAGKSLQSTMAVSRKALDAKLKATVEAEQIPPKVSKPKPKMLFCPICEEKMEKKSYATAEIYSCDVCGGYWCPNNTLQIVASYPQGELSRLLAIKLKILFNVKLDAELEVIAPHQCPFCKQNLLKRHYKKVIGVGVESCRQRCGTFIEKNVLEKIQILNKFTS